MLELERDIKELELEIIGDNSSGNTTEISDFKSKVQQVVHQ